MVQAHSHQLDDISLTYFKKDFERYTWGFLRQDMLAGISIAMLTLPQAMANALLAGLSIETGIFAAIFSAVIVALFGSSRHVLAGPSNAIAILIQGGLSTIYFTYYRDFVGAEKDFLFVQILTQLAFLVGIIQILAAFFKLGRLTHFVSHSVVIGYISGVALALVINQLFSLLGMNVPVNSSSLFERTIYIFTHLEAVNWPTTIIGFTCFFLLLTFKKINRKIPAGAIMLGLVAFLTYGVDHVLSFLASMNFQYFDITHLAHVIQSIPIIGDPRGDGLLPNWSLPYFNPGIMNDLLPVAFAIALLSVIETTSTAKAIAANSGQVLSTNQEIFGLGLGNLFSAFIGAMPVAGSASRSTVSYECGAKTRMAALFNSLFVAVILIVFGFLLRRIPVTAFSALLIVSAASIVNLKQLALCLKATRSDAFVFVLTILACIFFSLDTAFYIGVVMSITLYLKKAAIPQLVEFTIDEAGNLHSIDPIHQHVPRKIRFIKVEGELFFGAADLFQNALKTITEDDTTTKVIILQFKNARDVDATSCLALEQLYLYLRGSGRYLIACGLTQPIWDVFSDSGMIELIGKENLFFFNEKHPQLYLQKAFTRSYELLKLGGAQETEELPNLVEKSPSLPLEPVQINTSI